MSQIYHSNARTNINIRTEIQNKKYKNSELAARFNVSEQTISKWKNRGFVEDKSSKPRNIVYALNVIEKALITSLRSSTWLALDEVWEAVLQQNSKITRSSVYRCFVKEKINKIPQEKKEIAKKFKEYKPGFLHIDVTYLPKFEGKSQYLFVAIDRATRLLYCFVYQNKTAENAQDFIDKCLNFFPFEITHILTDNGLEFTNKLLISKAGKKCEKESKVDLKCIENDIEHRLTPPFSPKTNGMVERVNGTIKNDTILKTKYESKIEMEKDIMQFMVFYNLYRRHGSLRKELGVKTPFQAMEKWYELESNLFKETPTEFQKKLLDLQTKFNQQQSTTL